MEFISLIKVNSQMYLNSGLRNIYIYTIVIYIKFYYILCLTIIGEEVFFHKFAL